MTEQPEDVDSAEDQPEEPYEDPPGDGPPAAPNGEQDTGDDAIAPDLDEDPET